MIKSTKFIITIVAMLCVTGSHIYLNSIGIRDYNAHFYNIMIGVCMVYVGSKMGQNIIFGALNNNGKNNGGH